MTDYISREAALSAQNKSMNLSECRKRLERIPAADVRSAKCCEECRAALLETIDHYKQLCDDVRPAAKARWEPNVPPRDLRPRCSACGELQPRKTNFCPNCGADMREES